MQEKFYIERYDVVTSTNDIIREKAENGAPQGTTVIADAQTAGRGRMGRCFHSPGGGLYMSVLLYPDRDVLTITTRAAVAAAKVIEKHSGRETAIKWVNDIYQDGKKVCGILVEGKTDAASGKMAYAVLGIGINLREPPGGFPQELQGCAGAVFARDEEYDREAVAQDILREFFSPGQTCHEEYKQRNMLAGKRVSVIAGGRAYTAHVLDIEKDFGLRIRLENGEETVLKSGEVSVRIK